MEAAVGRKGGNVSKQKHFRKNVGFHSNEDYTTLREREYFKRQKGFNADSKRLHKNNFHNSTDVRERQNINRNRDDNSGSFTQPGKENTSDQIENEVYEYFHHVAERLRIGFEGTEEKAMFLANVVEQTNQKEVELSCDRKISHTLQMLLETCDDSVILMKFATAFSSSLRQLCTNQFGSHVIESLLSTGMNVLKKHSREKTQCQEKEASSDSDMDIINWLLKFGKFCLNNVDHFLGHMYASHILRALIEVWGGVKMEQSVRMSRRSFSQKRKFQSMEEIPISTKSNEAVEHTDMEVPAEFISQLREFYHKIVEFNNLIDCCIDAKVSPILQTLLLALQKRTPKLCQKFIKLLMKNAIERKNEEDIPIAMTDKSSSCVIEKVLAVADEKRQKWIWKHCFKSRMKQLTLHPIANFVAQRLFSTIQGKEQFEELFNEISPHFEDILSAGHNGVIVSICEACVRLGACQPLFMQIIMKTFQCLEPEQRHLYLAPLIIQLSTYSAYEERSKTSPEQNSMLFEDVPLSYHGSLLLQQMLRFYKPVKVVNSILSLKDDLKLIACDPTGSHILDSFLSGPHVGEKNRDKLLQALKPHLVTLACDKFGSRVLDNFWRTASLKQKILISQELSSKESELNNSYFGRFFSKKCGLLYFKTRHNDWKQVQNSESKKKKLFNDILS